jgi:hypothetical protein
VSRYAETRLLQGRLRSLARTSPRASELLRMAANLEQASKGYRAPVQEVGAGEFLAAYAAGLRLWVKCREDELRRQAA